MTALFPDALHAGFVAIATAAEHAGGSDPDEIAKIAAKVTAGDDESFHDAWLGVARELVAEADADSSGTPAERKGKYLRAAVYASVAWHPFLGPTRNDRLTSAFAVESGALAMAAPLFEPPLEPLTIPYEATTLPAYFVSATTGQSRRPLLIWTNGYDASISSMLVCGALAATARGYHCLLFDGPGQGAALIEQGLAIRPDWEAVVTPVVDAMVARDDVDPARIALMGWSLGGYLAPRAASGEHRLAACIADPGLPGIADQMRVMLKARGFPADQAPQFAQLPDATLELIVGAGSATREGKWRLATRAPYVHGVATAVEAVRALEPFTMAGRYHAIECPVLLTSAENDVLSANAATFLDALAEPKRLERFTAAEDAGDHCELANRSLLMQRVLDWLDEIVGNVATNA